MKVIAETVATPIEEQINGVEGMLYMSSQATTDGLMTLNVTFRLGTDPDKAQQLVQNRVAQAEPRLPEEVRTLGVTTIKSSPDLTMVVHLLSLGPFRGIVKDYFMICDSYYQAIRTATPDKIEAIDMGRRGIHDEGSRTLMERLHGKVRVDFETARRLFTLISVLHWKG